MEAPEEQTHSFVITFWLEEVGKGAGQVVWQGQITHVASRTRCSVNKLGDIVTFIVPYLEGLGVKLGPGWRVRQWLVRKLLGRG